MSDLGPFTLRGCRVTRSFFPEDSARVWGYIPGVDLRDGFSVGGFADSWWQSLPLLMSSGVSPNGGVPVAIPIPWATDGANVPYPDDHVLMVAGCGRYALWNIHNMIVDGALIASGVATVTVDLRRRRQTGRLLMVLGMKAGSSLTIEIVRYGNYRAPPLTRVVLSTHSFSADDGENQIVSLPDFVLPDDVPPRTSLPTFYYAEITAITGDNPGRVTIGHTPWYAVGSWVVPTEVPSGYTALPATNPQSDSYDIQKQRYPTGWGHGFMIGEHSPLNGPFVWDWGLNPSAQNPFFSTPASPSSRRQLALPDSSILGIAGLDNLDNQSSSHMAPPAVWDGTDIRRVDWAPVIRGLHVYYGSIGISGSASVAGSYTVTSLWLNRHFTAGTRHVRIWCVANNVGGSATITSVLIRFRIDGGTPITVDVTAATGTEDAATPVDAALDLLGADFTSTVQYQIEAQFSTTGSGSFNVAYQVLICPRGGIPSLYAAIGRGCPDVPAAYRDGKITSPVAVGGTLHVAPGDTTASWSLTKPTGAQQEMRVISFVPSATGYYRVLAPGSSAAATLGERLHRSFPRSAMVGRANRRFWGAFASATPSVVNGTWTLDPVTPTWQSVPGTGLAITAGNISPVNTGQFFGEIALPTAGRYRVILTGGTSLPIGGFRLLASLTDQYCSEPAEYDSRFFPTLPIGAFGATITNSPPVSPTTSTRAIVGDSPTGAFAGQAGAFAAWDGGSWKFLHPDRLGAPPVAFVGGSYRIRNADGTWSAFADYVCCEIVVSVEAATTLYVRCLVDAEDDATVIYPQGSPVLSWSLA